MVGDLPSPQPREDRRPVPEQASGRFDAARGTVGPTGKGPLVTYTVEVERGLPLQRRAVTRAVDSVLSSSRGWAATGIASPQRVESHPDFRIRLASPRTTDQLCSPLDTGGRLSCRNGDLVVLNAWRWVNGARTYANDLRGYRQYMINHEVGHALGNPHASCRQRGAPASVMVQQTKSLDGCMPNPWPRVEHWRPEFRIPLAWIREVASMTWYEVLLLFVGIPVGLFVLITVLVLRFTTPRVPDGVRRAAEPRDGESPLFDDEDDEDDALDKWGWSGDYYYGE
jgi:hypothetical protein